MHLLIDGYNLLFVAGIPGRGFGIKALERSRLGLLRFLVETLNAAERAQTTVVFDAKEAPPGLPRVMEYHGITVRFAAKYDSADALLAELIQADPAPRQLTVVSSDHEVQRAAKRRRARAVNSDAWHDEVVARRHHREHPSPPAPLKPIGPVMEDDVARWLEQFGGEQLVEEILREEQGQQPPPEPKTGRAEPSEKPAPEQPDDKAGLPDDYNPFPPGYGEDLEDDL